MRRCICALLLPRSALDPAAHLYAAALTLLQWAPQPWSYPSAGASWLDPSLQLDRVLISPLHPQLRV